MHNKLSSYLTNDNDEKEVFKIIYRREGSSISINDEHTSLSSAHAMSIDEYLLLQKKRTTRNKTKNKSSKPKPKPKQDSEEEKKKSSTKKQSKKGPINNSDRRRESELDQSSSNSVAESHQTTPARIQTTTASALAGPGAGGSRSIGSILEDIRLIRVEADKDCNEVDELKDLWQDDISRLLQKWEEQEKKRALRKQSLFVPRRSKQIVPASA
jgi:hypothetical protein